MYQPYYQISDKLLLEIVKLERAFAKAQSVKLGYDVRSKLTQKVKAQNIFHLGHMLGLQITLRDAEKLAEGRKPESEDARYLLLANFRNILEFNRSGVAEDYTHLSKEILLNINKIVINHWQDADRNEIRKSGLDGQLESWINYRNSDIQPENIEYQLDELLSWYASSENRTHNLVRMAVLFWRMVEIMPFAAGNKYTLIAVLDLLFYQYDYGQITYTPLVENLAQFEQEYWKSWDNLQRSQDQTQWLEKFIGAIAASVDSHQRQLDQMLTEQEEKNTSQPFLDLNKRQLKILRYLQNIPTVKRDDYCQMMDVSTMTAYRDLNDLVDKKLLKVEGQGRGTRYKLTSR